MHEQLKIVLLASFIAACGHKARICDNGAIPNKYWEREVEAHAALLSSPSYKEDLNKMVDDIGKEETECIVKASRQGFMQISNRDPDVTSDIKPHLAIGIERANEWLLMHEQGRK